jgi:AsmA protein
MRKIAVVVLVGVVLALGALFIAPQFIPADVYKEQVIRKVEAATGREMQINGVIGLRFLPSLQLTMEDVRLSNPEGFPGDESMMTLRELQISLGLFELIRGRVSVENFKLVEPVIRLARDGKGNPNWVFTPEEADKAAASASDESTSNRAGLGADINLPNLAIVDGTLTYREKPSAEPIGLSNLNANIKLPSLHESVKLSADTTWNGNFPVKLEATIGAPNNWLEDRETDYDFTLTGDGDALKLEAKGTARAITDDGRRSPVAKGEMHLQAASLKALGEKLGMTLLPANMPGEGKLSLRSMFNYQDPQLKLPSLTVSLDKVTLSGSGAVKMDGARPHVTAKLSTAETIALADFMPQKEPTVKPPKDAAGSTAAINGQGWSEEPLMADTSSLKAVDADVTLNIGGLTWDKLTMGAMEIAATLTNGNLQTRVPDFAFYGGMANADATVRVTGTNTLAVSKRASIQNADIGQFLKDGYDFDRLSGKGNVKLNINTSGASVKDFVNRLGGSGSFAMQNGAIHGFNLAQMVREARTVVQSVQNKDFTASMRSGASEDSAKTDFAELNGSFAIAQGMLSNDDLSLKAPLVTVTGKGTVNIPQRTVDYRLRPTIVGTIEGEGRTAETNQGVTIPLRVTGSFDTLKFTPDASGLVEEAIKDPEGTFKQMEDNVRGLRDDMKSLFKGL